MRKISPRKIFHHDEFSWRRGEGEKKRKRQREKGKERIEETLKNDRRKKNQIKRS